MPKAVRLLFILATALLVSLVAAVAQTNIPSDFAKVNYFANNVIGAPDATVRITNPGTASASNVSGGPGPTLRAANLCAMIYVFDNDQQLSACCGCEITPNGLLTLSLGNNLTGDPLTGVRPSNGTIELVSAADKGLGCDPTANVTPTAALRAWATHVDNPVGVPSAKKGLGLINPAYPITETEFTDATLGANELAFELQTQCSFAHLLGSGHGFCFCEIE